MAGTARSARSYTRFQPRRSVHTTSPYISARSTATFVPDQSHHSLVFFAPPKSVAVSGPSVRSCLMTWS